MRVYPWDLAERYWSLPLRRLTEFPFCFPGRGGGGKYLFLLTVSRGTNQPVLVCRQKYESPCTRVFTEIRVTLYLCVYSSTSPLNSCIYRSTSRPVLVCLQKYESPCTRLSREVRFASYSLVYRSTSCPVLVCIETYESTCTCVSREVRVALISCV
ncbi:hypothetical protein J6590_099688 [Homalodisca vitripennis]|nr:hypothetical protein J6590_099688 [Homalodisca vitripennis]